MTERATWRKLAVTLAALALFGAACRGGGDGESGGAGGGGGGGGGETASVKTDFGVSSDPCPAATNKDNGCIYLGAISDLTEGPFAAFGKAVTDSQKAFWAKVNKDGGIEGYDVDYVTYTRDNKYNPQVHNQVFQEIEPKVLALGQSLGSPTTAAIIDQLRTKGVVIAPATWTSKWAFEDVVAESGSNYCFEATNSVDYMVEKKAIKSVMALHYDGDYGDDAAAGAKIAAEANKLTFTDVETTPGQTNQAEAIERVVSAKPDLVVITTNGTDMSVIVGQAASRGFKGQFIGTSPAFNPGVLKGPAAAAIKAQFYQSAPWKPFATDSPGHQAMRDALGQIDAANDAYTAGWAWSYPLKAALEEAASAKDLTRAGLLKALKSLDKVDYQGMLPEGAGNYAAGSKGTIRKSVLNKPDDAAPTGVSLLEDFFEGKTAAGYEFTEACFDAVK
ncbi:MAG: ABC transporter substrate-binding protein [Acidimicrobiia bacterium]